MTTQPTPISHFYVKRDNLQQWQVAETAVFPTDLPPNQLLIAIDAFAFTANNITYAALGDALAYWQFFPAPDGWGCIPVWGFGDVVASTHPDVAVGERFYGYYPMASHVVVQPGKVGRGGFTDVTPHRVHLPVVYNQYSRTSSDPAYRADQESLQMLLRPLFMTSFLIDDFLADNALFGAEQVVLTSASSKTALGTAFLLAQRDNLAVIGLTSPANVAFVQSLGCYDVVLPYAQLATLDNTRPTVTVDFAGNGRLLHQLHHHFSDQLRYSSLVGVAHWDQRGGGRDLLGPAPVVFFAPAQVQKRSQEWGPAELQTRFATVWQPFTTAMSNWLTITHGRGSEAVATVYVGVLNGRSSPDQGHILSL